MITTIPQQATTQSNVATQGEFASISRHLVIPARLKSTRLPNKPLLEIHGKAMVLWVIDRALAVQQAGIADDVWLATDDEGIAELCRTYCQTINHPINIAMTSSAHASGTDRLAQVATTQGWSPQDIVINMQGDEPLVPSRLIEQVTQLLQEKNDCVMATLAEPISDYQQWQADSVVKVVKNANNEALYFSRSPIPYDRSQSGQTAQTMNVPAAALRHLGIYAYRVSLLQQFGSWQQSELERLESLEQLRILEHGLKIAIGVADVQLPAGVDTQADLDRLNAMDLSAIQC